LFEVKVSRRYTYYVWMVLLPMTLLVVASWLVFRFEPTNLQPQISTDLAILLSLVTFTYAIDFSLPKEAYLTFIDRYTLTSFAFVLAAIYTVSAIHVRLKMKWRGTGDAAPTEGPLGLPAGLRRDDPRDGPSFVPLISPREKSASTPGSSSEATFPRLGSNGRGSREAPPRNVAGESLR
jgi:hypothetical protein